MSNHYTAVILDSEGKDLGPLDIADATNDDDAGKFAMERVGPWLVANNVEKARIQIVKDGEGIRTIPVEVHR